MGCRVQHAADSITVAGGPLRGIEVDMNAISDTVQTLGAVALFAQGPTTVRNVAHIRHKETDRIAALAAELRKLGADVQEFLTVCGSSRGHCSRRKSPRITIIAWR
jgi:3-phosphoshikimate 1-carboxyvinyltransferase